MESMAIFLQIFTVLVFLSPSARSAPRVEAFTVELYGGKTGVFSPRRHHPRTHLIVKNKTLSSLLGRVEDSAGEVKKYVSIASNETLSFPLGMDRGGRLFFVPVSPPLQAYELKIGTPFYEIPPKR